MLVNVNGFSFAFDARSVYWKVPIPEVNGKLLDTVLTPSYILPRRYWCPTTGHSLSLFFFSDFTSC